MKHFYSDVSTVKTFIITGIICHTNKLYQGNNKWTPPTQCSYSHFSYMYRPWVSRLFYTECTVFCRLPPPPIQPFLPNDCFQLDPPRPPSTPPLSIPSVTDLGQAFPNSQQSITNFSPNMVAHWQSTRLLRQRSRVRTTVKILQVTSLIDISKHNIGNCKSMPPNKSCELKKSLNLKDGKSLVLESFFLILL